MADLPKKIVRTGYSHIAFSVGNIEIVDALTAELKADGYEVISGPQVMLYSDRKQVFVGETEISLTLKEYQLLEYFIMNQNQVLTKEMIMENIWGIDSEFIDPNTISVMISRLKKKLNDSSNVISNVFGMGYRMGE